MRLFIKIKGPIDSLKLWSLVEKYKVNLTDLEEVILIHGETNIFIATQIIARCAPFGDLKIELSGGS